MGSIITYDIEIARNRVVVGLLDDGEFHWLDLTAPISPEQASTLRSMCEGRTLVGFNNSGFDSYLLFFILERAASPREVFELAQALISSPRAWQVARNMNARKSPFDELDLLHFCKRAKLKVYEARLGMDRVETLPFDPEAEITNDMMPRILAYLRHDLDATQLLYERLEEEIDIRRELCTLFDLPQLMTKGPAASAEAVLISEYCRADGEVDIDDIRAAAGRMRNCDVTFVVEDWLKNACRGTSAGRIIEQIDGTIFPYRDGKRGVPDREWPSELDIDGIVAAIGVGGLHSMDDAGQGGAGYLDADVASYYPRLLLQPGGAPMHLDGALFCRIYRGLLERRLEAKAAGRKREANALKLVLNSSFGKLGDHYSPLFSPPSFLNVTVGGQLSLIALAERISRISKGRNHD
jgi:hypothetical protein